MKLVVICCPGSCNNFCDLFQDVRWELPGTLTPYTLASLTQSATVMTSATSVVATFSPFHLVTIKTKSHRLRFTERFKLHGTETQPERVSDSIVKIDEILLIDPQQVASVEVHVSFLEDVVQLLLLCLLQVSGITTERSPH